MEKTVCLKVEEYTLKEIDKYCCYMNVKRSVFIRDALQHHINRLLKDLKLQRNENKGNKK